MPEDKVVVLGLMTTKSARLEPVGELARRVAEAAKFVPLDRLAISPQCGFASSIVGNALTLEDQGRKLRRLIETAETIWAAKF